MGRLNRQIARLFGYDLMRYKKSFRFEATLDRLLRNFSFDGVLDIGANEGWFSRHCMKSIEAPFYAFEPSSKLAQKLEAAARALPRWHISRAALGDEEGEATLHLSGGSGVYSSLNAADPEFSRSVSELSFVGEETVHVTTLDRFAGENDFGAFRALLIKIDTQGHDFKVLKGGVETLKKAKAVIVELPFQNIYQSSDTWRDILNFMEAAGFIIYSLSPISSDKKGRLVEADAFFIRP